MILIEFKLPLPLIDSPDAYIDPSIAFLIDTPLEATDVEFDFLLLPVKSQQTKNVTKSLKY